MIDIQGEVTYAELVGTAMLTIAVFVFIAAVVLLGWSLLLAVAVAGSGVGAHGATAWAAIVRVAGAAICMLVGFGLVVGGRRLRSAG